MGGYLRAQKCSPVLRLSFDTEAAVRSAWRRVCPDAPVAKTIEILKETSNGGVYRLTGTGVIAKRALRETALFERLIYQDILAKLPLRALRFHGFLDEESSGFSWLFLEDAGGIECSLENETYRKLAASWLARLHVSAARIPFAADLPRYDAAGYRADLFSGRARILQNLGNPVFTEADRAVLRSILGYLDRLEEWWTVVDEFCANLPLTLIHNDLQSKNMHICEDQNGTRLCVFDWEYAGWGLPCKDLVGLNLAVYSETVREAWPALNGRLLQQAADTGNLFRVLSAISWAAEYLPWSSAQMRRLHWYNADLQKILRTLG